MEPQHLWLYFGLALLIMEIVTPGFFISIFSIGAIVASLFAFFDHSLKSQLIVFLLANIISFIYLRPLLLKILYTKESIKKTNIDSYIGKKGIVTEDINNLKDVGRIKVLGESWRAISNSANEINSGKHIIIENREGNKFCVSEIKEDN